VVFRNVPTEVILIKLDEMAEANLDKKPEVKPPPGLKAIIDHLGQVYPNQPNPLQVTTLLKYWLGGQDPLDYISMYNFPGDVDRNVPPHWHYTGKAVSINSILNTLRPLCVKHTHFTFQFIGYIMLADTRI